MTPDPLIVGTMASAAIPAVFEAQRIDTTSTSMHYVDGGVREVLPSQAAVDLGAQLLFTIAASPSDPKPAPAPGESFSDPGSLLDIAQRGVDLAVNEVSVEERHPRAGFPDDRERVLIQPSFEVHDTTEIDPGLIRINMAYGYFRAFDADKLRRGEINGLQYLIWTLWTDDLIGERHWCHRLETDAKMVRARETGFFDEDHMQEIRRRKNRIAELIVERFEAIGVDAFPRALSDPQLGDQSVLDWCETWEVHQDPQRSFLDSVDLWEAQIILPGTVSEHGSHPPIRESAPRTPYPLPQSVRDGLRYR